MGGVKLNQTCLLGFAASALVGCAMAGPSASSSAAFYPRPNQGQYVRPEWLNPDPTPRVPAVDPCQSKTYAALVGINEGSIYIPGLPGEKRIIRPAFPEYFENEFLSGELDEPQLVNVERYFAGQQLYAPTINTVQDRIAIIPEDLNRLTIELDREGYVQEIRCG